MPSDKTAIAKKDQLLRRITMWVAVMVYTASLPYVIFFFWCHWKGSDKLRPELESEMYNHRTTAQLWVMCPLAIFISMNLLVVWVAVAGLEFK